MKKIYLIALLVVTTGYFYGAQSGSFADDPVYQAQKEVIPALDDAALQETISRYEGQINALRAIIEQKKMQNRVYHTESTLLERAQALLQLLQAEQQRRLSRIEKVLNLL